MVADLTKIGDTICNYFVICQGNTSVQVSAIADSVKDFTRDKMNIKPFATDGLSNAEWVAMDYSISWCTSFYRMQGSITTLNTWADAKLTSIPDLD